MEHRKLQTVSTEDFQNDIGSEQDNTYSDIATEIEETEPESSQINGHMSFEDGEESNTKHSGDGLEYIAPTDCIVNNKILWLEEPTKLLLDLFIETRPKLGKYAALRNKTKMFAFLANEMNSRGYMFSAVQVENKVRSFEKAYKRNRFPLKYSVYQSVLEELFSQQKSTRSKQRDKSINEESDSEQNSDMEEANVEVDRRIQLLDEVELEASLPIDDETNTKVHWLEEPTKLLLALLKETRPKLGKYATLRNKSKMFTFVAHEMKKRGYGFTALQVENKVRSLEKRYKNTQNSSRYFHYQRDLEQIFGKLHTIPSKRMLSEGSDSELNSDMEHKKHSSRYMQRRQYSVAQRELQKIILRIAAERNQYHEKVLNYLKLKEEREQRKEERAARKLELLELFIREM